MWNVSLTSKCSHLYCYLCKISLRPGGYSANPMSSHQYTVNAFLTW